MKLLFFSFILLVSLLSVSFCKQNNTSHRSTLKTDDARLTIKIETLYSGLKNPWGMTWLPDGRLLVTERAGSILVFRDDKFTGQKIGGVPAVFAKGQGGLMDIQLHPRYNENGWIYLAYSKPVAGGATTAVMRAKLQGNQLVEKQEIFSSAPALSADFHFGCRLAFDKQNFLFIAVGERGTRKKVQQLSNDHGKIHRIFDDGRIPEDNPFYNQPGVKKTIWTYGHRNPQGMVYDAENKRLWAVEHGPKGGDELNLIEKGKNYGWPLVTYGINYDGSIISDKAEMEGVEKPVKYWVPSPAPCGMTLVTSDKYKGWKGNLLIANLAAKYLGRITLSGTSFKSEEKLLKDIGRVRHVAQSPDGFIYVVTEGPGKLLKIIPES